MEFSRRLLVSFLFLWLCEFQLATALCQGYYCGRKIDQIFVTGTHNSLALQGKVFLPNQKYGLITQYQAGVRLFTFDLYSKGTSTDIFTKHGFEFLHYHPKSDIINLVQAVRAQPHEFLIFQLEDYMASLQACDAFLSWIQDKLIKNFDATLSLGSYLELGRQILIVTDNPSHVNPSKGMHKTDDLITGNQYSWTSCQFDSNNLEYRRGPTNPNIASFKLMNHFCSGGASVVNQRSRIMFSARRFVETDYSNGKINGILVDYYDQGDVFGASDQIRDGDLEDDCVSGSPQPCSWGDTCWNCCSAAFSSQSNYYCG